MIEIVGHCLTAYGGFVSSLHLMLNLFSMRNNMNPSPAIANNPPAPIRPNEYLVPDKAKTTSCSSCGAGIIWTKTSKNGRAIPLSVATIRTADNGSCVALPHFVDCPHAAQHRKRTQTAAIKMDLIDLPTYLRARGLVVTSSRLSDNGDGWLTVELLTQKIA